mgnify:FL=1
MEKFLFAGLFLLRRKLTFVMDYVILMGIFNLMLFLTFYRMIS